MKNILRLEIIQSQGNLEQVQRDAIFAELSALLQMISQVAAEKKIDHHKNIFRVL